MRQTWHWTNAWPQRPAVKALQHLTMECNAIVNQLLVFITKSCLVKILALTATLINIFAPQRKCQHGNC
jgi:hypothetical protein